MSKYAIEIDNLGKRYRIAARRTPDETLAHAVARTIQQPIRRLGNLLRGNSTGAADLDQDFWALRHISFNVEHGETVGVIGQNGAGKSTLLKVLSRITYPTEGEARINGRVGSLLEVGTGFNLELTGRENIYLNGSILGMSTSEINSKFDEIVEFAGVGNFVDTPVKHFSSGMTVRLAFAVAAHLEPEILLIDEVLAVGDYAFQKKSLGKMQDVTKSGRTVLFVSHQLDMVRAICDRVILLRDGQVAMIGETDYVVDKYIDEFGAEISRAIEFTCPLEPERPYQLLGGRIKNSDGEVQQLFDVFDPVTVEIDYVIREPLEGAIVNFNLMRVGERLATSFDTDTHPERLETREVGQYRTCVTLPTPLLKQGKYALDLTIGYVRDGGGNRHRIENALNFDIELLSKAGTFLSYDVHRRGIIALDLDWQQETLSKQDFEALQTQLENSQV